MDTVKQEIVTLMWEGMLVISYSGGWMNTQPLRRGEPHAIFGEREREREKANWRKKTKQGCWPNSCYPSPLCLLLYFQLMHTYCCAQVSPIYTLCTSHWSDIWLVCWTHSTGQFTHLISSLFCTSQHDTETKLFFYCGSEVDLSDRHCVHNNLF